MTETIQTCSFILTRGDKKGNPCGDKITCAGSTLCATHKTKLDQRKNPTKPIVAKNKERKSIEIFDKEDMETLLGSNVFFSTDPELHKQKQIQRNLILKYYAKVKDQPGNECQVAVNYWCETYGRFRVRVGRNDQHAVNYAAMNMWADVRNYLFHKRYWDVDTVNAHPTITMAIFQHFNRPVDNFSIVVNQRKETLKLMMDKYNVDRKTAKNLILRITYGGKAENWFRDNNLEFKHNIHDWNPLASEIHDNIVYLLDNDYKEYFLFAERITAEKNDFKDPYCRAWAYLCQDIERKAIEALWDSAVQDNFQVGSVIHDGLHLDKRYTMEATSEFFPDWEKAMTDAVEESMKISIPFKLEIKPMELTFSEWDLQKSDAAKPLREIDWQYDEEKEYTAIKKIFEDRHMFITNRACYIVLEREGRYLMKTRQEMKIMYEHLEYHEKRETKNDIIPERKKFIDRWFKDAEKRTYLDVGVYPPPLSAPAFTYNLWAGYPISYVQPDGNDYSKDVEYILDHMRYMSGDEKLHGNPEEPCFKYLCAMESLYIQKPGFKPQIMITYRSEAEGVGKTTMANMRMAYMGSQYAVLLDEPEKFMKEFNAIIENKIFIFLDEFDGTAGNGSAGRKLMSLISTKKDVIRKMRENAYDTISFTHYEAATNVAMPKKLTESNRRDLILDIKGTPKPESYYTKLYSLFDNEQVMRAFYDYFMTYDNSYMKDWIRQRPVLEYQEELKQASRDKELNFLIEYFMDNIDTSKESTVDICSNDLLKEFNEWCKQLSMDYKTTDASFGLKMKKHAFEGMTKTQRKGRTYWVFDIKQCKQYLVKKGYCSEKDFDDYQAPPKEHISNDRFIAREIDEEEEAKILFENAVDENDPELYEDAEEVKEEEVKEFKCEIKGCKKDSHGKHNMMNIGMHEFCKEGQCDFFQALKDKPKVCFHCCRQKK